MLIYQFYSFYSQAEAEGEVRSARLYLVELVKEIGVQLELVFENLVHELQHSICYHSQNVGIQIIYTTRFFDAGLILIEVKSTIVSLNILHE